MNTEPLFKHISEEHDINLLEGQLLEIINVVQNECLEKTYTPDELRAIIKQVLQDVQQMDEWEGLYLPNVDIEKFLKR